MTCRGWDGFREHVTSNVCFAGCDGRRYVPTPVQFEKTPISVRSAAPRLGEHTDEILGELGYSDGQIRELREREVV